MSRQRKPNYLLNGMMTVLVGHFIFAFLSCGVGVLLAFSNPYAIFFPWVAIGFIGMTQLVYVIPLIIWLEHKRKFEMVKGAMVGAVVTALLNGSCYLLVMAAS